jgi:hypothetical protein
MIGMIHLRQSPPAPKHQAAASAIQHSGSHFESLCS